MEGRGGGYGPRVRRRAEGSNGFLANLGTPTPDSIEAVNLGLAAASRLGRMTLLDPVGYGASRLRVELFDGILERHELSILKGNAL